MGGFFNPKFVFGLPLPLEVPNGDGCWLVRVRWPTWMLAELPGGGTVADDTADVAIDPAI
jgi:hypothetical protein